MTRPRTVPALAAALCAGLLLAPPSVTQAQDTQAAGAGVIALVGGDVHTVSGDVLRGATVLVRDGEIAAVGADVDVPAGARTIDCSGQVVTPGLIDADCWLGLDAADARGRVAGAHIPVAPAFDPFDGRIAEARAHGVTALHLAGNTAQLLGGTTAVVSTGAANAEPLVVDGAVALNASTMQAASGLPAAARVSSLRNVLIGAESRVDDLARWRVALAEYEEERLDDGPTKEERLLLPPELLERMRRWSPADKVKWREAVYKGMGREKAWSKPKEVAAAPKTPRDDPSSERIAELFTTDGDTPQRTAFVRAELGVDVGLTLEVLRDFDLDAVLCGGQGLLDHARDIAKAQARVVLSNTADMSWSGTSPLRRRERGLAAGLVSAGLRPALASGGAGAARHLRLLAASAVGEGMERADALAAITLWAAEAAGVADVTGSLETGKRADVVVWSGDPLSAASRAEVVLVGGREVME